MDEPKITVPIDIEALDKLIAGLGPGTYTLIATDDRVTIKGLWVNYVFKK